ncbi:MAG: sulfite reductase (NADPH) flavoprotein alpha-component [Thiomicrorhabdus sp.]|nr:MAG: sulfite reductase (NADPH) flavoprotein alpha-component [Thiomicrorhabdus sp.]
MQFSVIQNTLLTPDSPDKAVYNLILAYKPDQNCAELTTYQPGDWLTVNTKNHDDMISTVLSLLGLTGSEHIELRRIGEVTIYDALQQHLEITQLNPAILNKIKRQYALGDWPDRQAMMDYADGRDIVDLLQAFPTLKTMGVEFLGLLSPLAPRYYSIASQADATGEVSLVYKQVVYEREGRIRQGVASRYLSALSVGKTIEGEFKNNAMFKLPEDPQTPIIMVGAGTGIAPFIGFMQQRAEQATSGKNLLFFGETNRIHSFLFEDELMQWQQEGKLQLFTAFSRDQAEKEYVQDVIRQQKIVIQSQIEQGGVIYICGSQIRLAAAVEQALTEILSECGLDESMSWQALKESRRIQMDVY